MPMVKPEPSAEELAVRAGFWRVTLPVWPLMMAFIWPPILYLGIDKAMNSPEGLSIAGVFIIGGLAAGWMWWSFAAPRWRLWAYQRVTDLEQLERLAVAEKLIWPHAHLFTRTELRMGNLGNRLRAFEAAMSDANDR